MISQLLTHKEQYLKKKRKRRYILFGVTAFLLLSAFVGSIFLSRMERFRISHVVLSGGVLINQEEIQKVALDYLDGYYLWVFPKNNAFLYPHNGLRDFLENKLRRIDTITITLKGFDTLDIKLTERGMYALWCDILPSEVEQNCYFMDSDGVVFSEAPSFSGDAYFKYYGALSTTTSPIGKSYLPETPGFKEIVYFIDAVKKTSLHPVYLVAKDDGGFDLVTANGGHIYFDLTQSAQKSADNLSALLKTIATSSASGQAIDYIDLRYGNKLFYKLK